jgi:hypothetical protein
MTTDAPKPLVPPAELADRSEGFGDLGVILGYPQYTDDGVWPDAVERNNVQPEEHSETSDRQWFRVENQGIEEVNNFQGEVYEI